MIEPSSISRSKDVKGCLLSPSIAVPLNDFPGAIRGIVVVTGTLVKGNAATLVEDSIFRASAPLTALIFLH